MPFFNRFLAFAILGAAIMVAPTAQTCADGQKSPLRAQTPAQHWREAQSCGVACGYMLARFLGAQVTYSDAVAAIPIEHGGTSVLALQQGLATLGVSATVLKAKPRDLDHLATPMIAHVLPRGDSSDAVGHFLLVLQIDDRSVRYIEPNYAASIETVPRSQFIRGWSGYLIQPQRRQSSRSLAFVLWGVIAASISIGSFPLVRRVLRNRPIGWRRAAHLLAGLLLSCLTLGCAALPVDLNASLPKAASTGAVDSRPAADLVRVVAWSTEADLGVLPQNGAAEGVFRIENQGASSVRLHLGSPSCRCSEARLERETLASGESTSVHMVMRSRPHQAGPADARVYIEAEGGVWAEALSVHGVDLGANFPNYTYMIGGPANGGRTASIVGTLFLMSSSSMPNIDVPLTRTGLESVLFIRDIRIGPPVEMTGCVRRECSFALGVQPRAGVVRERREVVIPVRVTIGGEVSTHSIRVTILPSAPETGSHHS